MSVHEEANLVLKLYDLRREDTMRTARNWFFANFHPGSVADIDAAMFSEHSAHLRMVLSYWEMAAVLCNRGAVSLELFTETNPEGFGVFAKMEPFLSDLRAKFGPQYMAQFEKVVDATPGGRERTAKSREMFQIMRERLEMGKTEAVAAS